MAVAQRVKEKEAEELGQDAAAEHALRLVHRGAAAAAAAASTTAANTAVAAALCALCALDGPGHTSIRRASGVSGRVVAERRFPESRDPQLRQVHA